MLKVYLEAGLEDRLEAVVGEQLTENEKYLMLLDGNIRRRIPHSRIVHIEDLSEALVPTEGARAPTSVETPVQQASVSQIPQAPVEQQPIIPGQKQFNMAEIRQALRDGRKKGSLPDIPVDEGPGAKTFINVIVTGADNRSMTIEVPERSFTPDQYTASTAKELSKDPNIKALLENGMVFDGPPNVVGKNVYIKTKHLSEKVTGVAEKMSIMSKLGEAGAKFMQPEKAYQTDFSMGVEAELPAIPHSPFDGPINLDEIAPISPEIVVEGDPRIEEAVENSEVVNEGESNENSAEEGGTSEEEVGGETSEGDQRILEKSTDT